VEGIDRPEVATAVALGVAACPPHAVVANAAATIAIASRRQGNRIRSS
jgi:hypothetical protein